MRRLLQLTEGQPAELVALAVDEYQALQILGLIDIAPTLDPGWFTVAAGRKVGVVTVGSLQITVHPKIQDINRLVFLLGYAKKLDVWRDDEVHLHADDELLPALAEAFSRLASRALEQGLLQSYQTVSESLPVLRGRLRASEQMSHRFGLPLPLEVEYDDYTVDIAENRILLMAVVRLLRLPDVSVGARKKLLRLQRSLADVTCPAKTSPPPKWHRSRLNERYHAALTLAEIVLAAESFEQRIGDLIVSGFMFDMWGIFEDFVTTALAEALNPYGGRAVPQCRTAMDEAAEVTMKPDLVWLRGDGTVGAVMDAKYKAEKPAGFPGADLYQLLAYCTVLGLREGHLVYAKGNELVRKHKIVRSDVTIHCHALDLSLSPMALLASIDRLAASVI
ncbi:restriction endonuclease [Rhodococcus opacus]|uniref:McrC family protein n=1 Tax=Rhodococcus opacus TaxID=37919 RepID=UPI0007CD6CF6|nr:restriction endonuclease [Rhodococcus opacus]MDX5962283.1 restriction endonuclease [Rhodococcus opacus]NKY74824.1 restriction endonuclease [Rhodococcus opacus]CAG7641740.1 hypothetical protein E143388_08314 [Rhodococcus opacus]